MDVGFQKTNIGQLPANKHKNQCFLFYFFFYFYFFSFFFFFFSFVFQTDLASILFLLPQHNCLLYNIKLSNNQRTIGPENAHLKPDPGVLSHHEMTLTLNTHTPLLNS